MSKQDALIFARQLEIDRFVRKLATVAGDPDERCINFRYDWMDGDTRIKVRCTQGAGTNSASVQIEGGAVLYQADDYGQNINVYRHGQWAHRLIELADAEYQAELERRAEREAAREAAEAANFKPIDF